MSSVATGQLQTLFVAVSNAAGAAEATADHLLIVRGSIPISAGFGMNVSGAGWTCAPPILGPDQRQECTPPGPLPPGFTHPTVFVAFTPSCPRGSTGSINVTVSVQVTGGGSPPSEAQHTTIVACI